MVEEILKKNGIKITKQRLQIFNYLNEPKTIKDINENNKNVDKSTIYRIIELFLKKNIIVKEIKDNMIMYKIDKNEHIHYLKCLKCQKEIKLNKCPIKKIEGFKILKHDLVIQGVCDKCD